ncbi:MAG: hypothetical protein BWK80_35515 [Desulfobacteraceae bacterium IS3]|nr:MAG: hypothetical protein BWK80_35515 [Desulfobacteraceae bacterium IS3]
MKNGVNILCGNSRNIPLCKAGLKPALRQNENCCKISLDFSSFHCKLSVMEFLNKAEENLTAAQICFENGLYNACANRAYYAALHAAVAGSGRFQRRTDKKTENLSRKTEKLSV